MEWTWKDERITTLETLIYSEALQGRTHYSAMKSWILSLDVENQSLKQSIQMTHGGRGTDLDKDSFRAGKQ